MSALPSTPLERVRHHLVGLKMVRALETLDSCVRQLEEGTISALEMLDELLGEEHSTRETRRIKAQLMTARLTRIKTLEGFVYTSVPLRDTARSGIRRILKAMPSTSAVGSPSIVNVFSSNGTAISVPSSVTYKRWPDVA